MAYINNEKQDLLLKYLCMALLYDVMVDYEGNIYILNEIDPSCKDIGYITARIQDVERLMCAENVMIENIRPYLRPMSSMTEEEYLQYHHIKYNIVTYRHGYKRFDVGKFRNVGIIPIKEYLDWLLKNHFDFMGLIPKDLAIEVTKENNPYKN